MLVQGCRNRMLVCQRYLLPPGFGVLLLPLPQRRHELREDGLSVLHLLDALKSGISTVSHPELTKRCSVKRTKTEEIDLFPLGKWRVPTSSLDMDFRLARCDHGVWRTFKSIGSTIFCGVYLGVSLDSSISFLNSSLACISLFFFSFLSSSALVFTYISNTCQGQTATAEETTLLQFVARHSNNKSIKNERRISTHLFPLLGVEQQISRIKYYFM